MYRFLKHLIQHQHVALKDKNGQRGNGIGLASVKKIVEKCRGEIKVESELGKGANFMFSLAK